MQMLNFDDLQVVESVETQNKIERLELKKNYVIGCDPSHQVDEDINVFSVFDKFNGRFILKIKTKKSFDWFCNFLILKSMFKNYIISYKFITTDGRAKRIDQIRVETGGFETNLAAQRAELEGSI